MIRLHRLNGHEIVVNAELIEAIEAHGIETVIIMATNNRIVVKEAVEQVIALAYDYRRALGPTPVPRPLRREFVERHPHSPAGEEGAAHEAR